MFLHGGWFHLIGNMWFLWIFGNNVEDSIGHGRFAVFYVLCGLAAAAAQIASNPDSAVPMVGASGAIGGVMGAYILLYPRVHVHMLILFGFFITTIAVPAVLMLGYWLLVQVLSGFASLGAQGGGLLPITRNRGFLNTRRSIMNVSREPWDGPVAVEEDESRRRGQSRRCDAGISRTETEAGARDRASS